MVQCPLNKPWILRHHIAGIFRLRGDCGEIRLSDNISTYDSENGEMTGILKIEFD
jgi:hypothetical protein